MSKNDRVQFWLSRFAFVCVLATLALIFVGGMVTSKSAGLAVPDWPLSYGSVNPPGWMEIENVRLEHGHRLIAATLGLLTVALTVWVWKADRRRWMRCLAVAALIGVVLQGVMGGLRVTERSTLLAVIHGCMAQAFLCLLVVLAVGTSPRRRSATSMVTAAGLERVRWMTLAVAGAVYIQLIIGAVMRHYKAGLAIPDFPLAFGQLIPPMASFAIAIHFAHRLWAMVVTGTVIALVVSLHRHAAREQSLMWPGWLLVFLTGVQIALGASVIWLAKAPIPTTFHVVNGALILSFATALAARARLLAPAADPALARRNASGGGLAVAEVAG